MSPVSENKNYNCRNLACLKRFTNRSNRDRHEKRFNHRPMKDKSENEPIYEVGKKIYKCALPGCFLTSRYKGNIVRHMSDCPKQTKRKIKLADNKRCPYCGMEFVQKSNRDRHVKNQHSDLVSGCVVKTEDTRIDHPVIKSDSGSDESDLKDLSPSMVSSEIRLAVSLDETPIHFDKTVIEKATNDMVVTVSSEDTHFVTGPSEDDHRQNKEPLEPSPFSSFYFRDVTSQIQASSDLGDELMKRVAEREQTYSKLFCDQIIQKLKTDLEDRHHKKGAIMFLQETLGNMLIHDSGFLRWFADRLDCTSFQLKNILLNG